MSVSVGGERRLPVVAGLEAKTDRRRGARSGGDQQGTDDGERGETSERPVPYREPPIPTAWTTL
jgi:hypothetical protein